MILYDDKSKFSFDDKILQSHLDKCREPLPAIYGRYRNFPVLSCLSQWLNLLSQVDGIESAYINKIF